ncbi:heat shock factor protein-like isoform X2 [Anthonomus grandis grandis]|uniref:heat shock factor protein-like isoform X2 n=1 Tax=Anthonomus grandis grandis TaxID=2921223 RepID=UPI00216691D1|nr:heat shock factor protein-like isoform X2 [Anthonomus grandis grandis]
MQVNGSLPAFVVKLWKMVNDPRTDHLIRWSQNGTTFIIKNEVQFWYDLLPVYYKHNNMSSFVRQLNLYGFHKISHVLENPSLNPSLNDADEEEDMHTIKFYHPYFQKDQFSKLKNIKRKASSSAKPNDNNAQDVLKNGDLTKVLSDMKYLRGRQSGVDAQLTAMKQENTVLWRELAMLRQKHVKQQQIVNKLIQFLVTLVQPTEPPPQRMTMGVKRRMPLMLHESPLAKKTKAKKANRCQADAGPVIQELSKNDLSPEELLHEAAVIEENDNIPIEAMVPAIGSPTKIDSPITPSSQISQDSLSSKLITSSPNQNFNIETQNDHQETIQQNSEQQLNSVFWDKPEFVIVDNYPEDSSDHEIDLIDNLQKDADKVFLNPSDQNSVIPSLLNNDSSNTSITTSKPANVDKRQNSEFSQNKSNLQLATKDPMVKILNGDDLDLHLDHTQSELNQLKDILNGCNNLDTTTLLGLFSDNDPDDGFKADTLLEKENLSEEGASDELVNDPIASANSLIDFSLFDKELNAQDGNPESFTVPSMSPPISSEVNTPVMEFQKEPVLLRKC